MTPKPLALSLAIAFAVAGLTGCNTMMEPSRARTSAPYEPTALIIADETGPLTADELAAHRPAIIQYLVSRGYLETPDALVDNPAAASRFIRVILSPGGSFRITEFTLGNRARQVITSSYIPGHSDDYDGYGRYGYYNYLTARAYNDPPAYSPAPSAPAPDYQPAPPSDRRGNYRPTDRPRRYERRINPEGRGSERTTREGPRSEGGSSGGSTQPSSPPPSYSPPPEPRSTSGESRYEERHRPNEP